MLCGSLTAVLFHQGCDDIGDVLCAWCLGCWFTMFCWTPKRTKTMVNNVVVVQGGGGGGTSFTLVAGCYGFSIVSNDDPSPSFSAAAVAVPAQQQAPAQQVMNQPVRGPPQADAAGAQRKKAAPGAGGMLGDMMNPMALPMGAALFAFVGAVLILVGTHGMFKLDPYDYYYGRGDGTSIGLLDTVTARRPLSDLAF